MWVVGRKSGNVGVQAEVLYVSKWMHAARVIADGLPTGFALHLFFFNFASMLVADALLVPQSCSFSACNPTVAPVSNESKI